LGIQIKCTYAHEPQDGKLDYPLSIKNYDDLRDPMRTIPALLVVLYVPKSWVTRLRWTDKSLILKKVAFWRSLRGAPATNNAKSIKISMNQQLSPDALSRLMFLAAQGEL
jgi:hypothetical protein